MARAAGIGPGDVGVWFGDQARIGQKNKATRRWARLVEGSARRSRMERQAEGKRGTRPVAPRDRRTASTHVFGAVCPKEGKAVGLVPPRCNTEAMALRPAATSAELAPGRHAAAPVDQAGRRTPARRHAPHNVTPVPLPAKCPEPNAQENVWQSMRDNGLSNRILTSHDNPADHCRHAWNKPVEQPWRIMSLGPRDRAHEY